MRPCLEEELDVRIEDMTNWISMRVPYGVPYVPGFSVYSILSSGTTEGRVVAICLSETFRMWVWDLPLGKNTHPPLIGDMRSNSSLHRRIFVLVCFLVWLELVRPTQEEVEAAGFWQVLLRMHSCLFMNLACNLLWWDDAPSKGTLSLGFSCQTSVL